MSQFEKTIKNKVVRGANRAVYDEKEIHDILDDSFLCHISFVMNGEPFIIPTAYARDHNKLYIHGSVKSRFIKAAEAGIPLCVCVTHLDGLVLARSAFHHSVNYRSAIIYGNAIQIENNNDKREALKMITENFLIGRWDEVRQPNQKELDITSVLEVEINSASAKVRKGAPVDDKEDYELDIWAGELPIRQVYDNPIADEKLGDSISLSNAVKLVKQTEKE